jgi:hypothetical protein
MKKITEPKSTHWIYEEVITCNQCTGEFQCETSEDWTPHKEQKDRVSVVCPYCNNQIHVYRPESIWDTTNKVFEDLEKYLRKSLPVTGGTYQTSQRVVTTRKRIT